MHVTHPHLHPRRALLAAAAALALALSAFVPATLDDLSFGSGSSGPRAADAPAPAATAARAEPRWTDNPFAWPLLQMPAARR
jgi:hypothetical protein